MPATATKKELPIRVNPELLKEERETHFYVNENDLTLELHTDHRAVMSYLRKLAKRDTEVDIQNQEVRKVEGKKAVVAMQASLPLGYLKLQGAKRTSISSQNISSICSNLR